jgi:hypothetical protein
MSRHEGDKRQEFYSLQLTQQEADIWASECARLFFETLKGEFISSTNEEDTLADYKQRILETLYTRGYVVPDVENTLPEEHSSGL